MSTGFQFELFVTSGSQIFTDQDVSTVADESPLDLFKTPRNNFRLPGQDPIVDTGTAAAVAEGIYCYIVPVLVVFGTMGNVLALCVLCREKKRDTTNMSLTALAVSDTGYIITTFVRQTSCIIGKFDAPLARNFNILMFGQMIPINICFSRITGLITALISVERCVAVIIPLKVRDLVTRTRMLAGLIVVYFGTFILIGPVFFMGESGWTTNLRSNISYVRYSMTRWYVDNKTFADNYRDIFLNIFFRFIPTGIVCFNTVAIIARLKVAKIWRGDTSSSSNQAQIMREKKLMIMLVTLCIIFLFCTIPGLLFQIVTYTVSEFSIFGKYRNTYKLMTAVSLLTQYINSSINFVVYIGLNERFAKSFRQMFACIVPQRV